jgi:hypothetical protein
MSIAPTILTEVIVVTIRETTIAKIQQLPESLVQQIIDFIDFIARNHPGKTAIDSFEGDRVQAWARWFEATDGLEIGRCWFKVWIPLKYFAKRPSSRRQHQPFILPFSNTRNRTRNHAVVTTSFLRKALKKSWISSPNKEKRRCRIEVWINGWNPRKIVQNFTKSYRHSATPKAYRIWALQVEFQQDQRISREAIRAIYAQGEEAVITTLRKQGMDVLDALKQLFAGNPILPSLQPE